MPRLIEKTPSREAGIGVEKEMFYRRLAANLIQDMGQRLKVHQVAINTGIVLMHRFYLHHSVARFHRNKVALVSLFMASKMEETPRSLEDIICASHMCLVKDQNKAGLLDRNSELFVKIAKELTIIENIMGQTLGRNLVIDFPHAHIVKVCQLMRANKDLVRSAYFLATNTLHLTTFCLEFRPALVACMCIQLACKWDNWTIPRSIEGKVWFKYVDESVSEMEIMGLMKEFVDILNKVPSKLKFKVPDSGSPSGVKVLGDRRGNIAGPSRGIGSQGPPRGVTPGPSPRPGGSGLPLLPPGPLTGQSSSGRSGFPPAGPVGSSERGTSAPKMPRMTAPLPPQLQQQQQRLLPPGPGPTDGSRPLPPGMIRRPANPQMLPQHAGSNGPSVQMPSRPVPAQQMQPPRLPMPPPPPGGSMMMPTPRSTLGSPSVLQTGRCAMPGMALEAISPDEQQTGQGVENAEGLLKASSSPADSLQYKAKRKRKRKDRRKERKEKKRRRRRNKEKGDDDESDSSSDSSDDGGEQIQKKYGPT